MGKNIHQPSQIIAELREAEVLSSKGQTIESIVRHLGITEQTYYRWRKAYGGMQINKAIRLKKLLVDLSLDNAILKQVAKGNF